MKPMLRRALLVLLVVALAFVVFAPRPPRKAGPVYRVAAVAPGDIVRTVTATGTLKAVNTVTVGAQVSGQIATLHADYNAVVRAGDPLVEIDPATYRARVAEAEADLAAACASLELQRLQLRRSEELRARRLVSQAEHDQAAAEAARLEAVAARAAAVLYSARVDLGRTRIVSPIAGVVIERAVERGQTVQSNFATPALFTLAEDLARMEITASVSEADIGAVAPGQPVAFTVDAFPGETFAGLVRELRNNPSVLQSVVSYPVVVSVDNAALRLRPGMTAYLTITTGRREGVLRVPATALRFRPADAPASADEGPARATVYLLSGYTADPAAPGRATGTPRAQPVTLGLADRAHAEVVSGLEAGALVVTGEIVGEDAGARRNPFLPTPPR